MFTLFRYFYFLRPAARLVWRLMLDRRVSLPTKVLPLLAVAYLLTPIDLIPDFIPIRGQLDDLFVAAILLGAFVIASPWKVVVEHALGRSAQQKDLRQDYSGPTIDGEYRVEDDDAK